MSQKKIAIAANPNSKVVTGEVTVHYSLMTPLDVFKKDLGQIGTADATHILNTFNEINNISLTTNDVIVGNIGNGTALIEALNDSKEVFGRVTVTYSSFDLSNVKKKDLGTLKSNKEVFDRFVKLNNLDNIVRNDVIIDYEEYNDICNPRKQSS